MLLRDLHKIGPGDTPFSSPASLHLLVQAGLAWLAGELRRGSACCKPPGTQALGYNGTKVPTFPTQYLGSPEGTAPWPVQAQPGSNLTLRSISSN